MDSIQKVTVPNTSLQREAEPADKESDHKKKVVSVTEENKIPPTPDDEAAAAAYMKMQRILGTRDITESEVKDLLVAIHYKDRPTFVDGQMFRSNFKTTLLGLCVEYGGEEYGERRSRAVNTILEQCANTPDALFSAATTPGLTLELQAILDHGVNPMEDSSKGSALEKLLQNKCLNNPPNPDTPLHPDDEQALTAVFMLINAINKYENGTAYLIKTLTSQNINSLLSHAAKSDEKVIAKIMLSLGNFSNPIVTDLKIPLCLAVKNGSKKVLQQLVTFSPNLDSSLEYGLRALDIAVMKQNSEMIDILISAGANFKHHMPGGKTPLSYIVESGNINLLNDMMKIINQQTPNPIEGILSDKQNRLQHSNVEANILSKALNQRNKDGTTPLHIAASKGYTEIISTLLANGADPLIEDNDNNSALEPAIASGCYNAAEIIEEAIKKHPNGNAYLEQNKEKINQSFFHMAVKTDNFSAALSRIKNGANVCIPTNAELPIITVINNGCTKIIPELIPVLKNAGVILPDEKELGALLEQSIKNSHRHLKPAFKERLAAISTLCDCQNIDKKGLLSQKLERGQTLLNLAIENNEERINIEIIRELVRAGADLNLPNKHGLRPLDYIKNKEDIEILRILVSNGAKLDCFDKEGHTPFTRFAKKAIAGEKKNEAQLFNSLLDAFESKPDFAAKKKDLIPLLDNPTKQQIKETPLLLLIKNNCFKTAIRIIKLGVDVNKATTCTTRFLHTQGLHYDRRPLDLAILNGAHKVIYALIVQGGADLNYFLEGKGFRMPLLHFACTQSNNIVKTTFKAIQARKETGASVINLDIKDESGRTPLCMLAAQYPNKQKVIKKLVDAGANPSLPDNNRKTPFEYLAEQYGENKATGLLEKTGLPEKGH